MHTIASEKRESAKVKKEQGTHGAAAKAATRFGVGSLCRVCSVLCLVYRLQKAHGNIVYFCQAENLGGAELLFFNCPHIVLWEFAVESLLGTIKGYV